MIARAFSLMPMAADRKSTRLNSSHMSISYAVFCLKKKILRHGIRLHVEARQPHGSAKQIEEGNQVARAIQLAMHRSIARRHPEKHAPNENQHRRCDTERNNIGE